MLNIKVLGGDAAANKQIEELVLSVADSMALDVKVTHSSDANEIAKWQVKQTPALVVNDHFVCAGRIPMDEEVASYLLSQPA